MEVLEQRGSALTGLERVVGVRQPNTLGRGEKVSALGYGFRAVLRRLAGRGEYGGPGMVPTVEAWHAICSDRGSGAAPPRPLTQEDGPQTRLSAIRSISPFRVSGRPREQSLQWAVLL